MSWPLARISVPKWVTVPPAFTPMMTSLSHLLPVSTYQAPLTIVMKPPCGQKCSLSFGSIDEARSLQVWDLITLIITAATSKDDDLPKSSTVTLCNRDEDHE